MEPGSTIFLKVVVYLMGIIIIALCIFRLPWRANVTTEINPEVHRK